MIFYSINDLMKFLNLKRRTILKLVNEKKLKAFKVGKEWIIKPDVVHFGDDVSSFATDGSITNNSGTSFSTPRITSLAGNIYNNIDEEFDSLLIKALLIHNAKYDKYIGDEDERIKSFGYGRPCKVEDMLYNLQNEATIIIRDTLVKGEFIDIFDFPVPDSLTKEGTINAQITATLVYNQHLDPKEGNEYCQSNIELKMGVFDNVKERDIEKSNLLKNPFGKDNPTNLLNKNVYSSSLIKQSDSQFSKYERNLIDYNGKYYPVKKYTVDLSELSGVKKNQVTNSNKWFLQIVGQYRNEVESNSKSDGEILSQDFCVIVTVKDPTKSINIYDDTMQKIIDENFIYETLKLKNQIFVKKSYK